jgi:hypothetical protein
MQTLIVYVDDASHALEQLAPMLAAGPGRETARWILVGCAPRVTHHVSKWVTRSARENWRGKWADKLFARLVPALSDTGDEVLTCLAAHPLHAQLEALLADHAGARLIDARRPKLDDRAQLMPGRKLLALLMSSSSSSWLALAD